jgi:sugar-specific transcriptional regulator TrmB
MEIQLNSSSNADANIKNLLKNYGLTRLEIDVYLGLLQRGESKATILSHYLGMNRVEVYRVLKRLVSRGLVSTTASEPVVVYEAVKPGTALKVLIKEVERKVRKLRELAPEVLLELETIDKKIELNSNSTSLAAFKILRGEAAVEGLNEKVAAAEIEILGVWSLRRMYSYGMIETFLETLKRGCSAQIICEITKENAAEAEELSALTNLHHCPGIEHSLRFTIIDGKELILGVAAVDSTIDSLINVFSTSRDLIQLVTRQFQILWDESITPDKKFFVES